MQRGAPLCMPLRAHAHHVRSSTNCDKLSGDDNAYLRASIFNRLGYERQSARVDGTREAVAKPGNDRDPASGLPCCLGGGSGQYAAGPAVTSRYRSYEAEPYHPLSSSCVCACSRCFWIASTSSAAHARTCGSGSFNQL
jgi:hypothetical protein